MIYSIASLSRLTGISRATITKYLNTDNSPFAKRTIHNSVKYVSDIGIDEIKSYLEDKKRIARKASKGRQKLTLSQKLERVASKKAKAKLIT